jgi:hypothetical protein
MRFLKRTAATALGALMVFGLLAINDASAQIIQRQVIGNGATMVYDTQGDPVLYGTVGMAVVGASGFENGSYDIYHGFWFFKKTSSVVDPVAETGSNLWNSPNPFTSETTIHYNIPNRSLVRLRVYDMAGALIRTLVDEQRASGSHQVLWDGLNETGAVVATGYYYYTLDAQPTDLGGRAVNYRQKMLLMK